MSTQSQGTIPCGYPGCPKVFVHKEHRNRHAKTHDEKQRPICPICNKPFSREDSLRRHMQQHEQRAETASSVPGQAPPAGATAFHQDIQMSAADDDHSNGMDSSHDGSLSSSSPTATQTLAAYLNRDLAAVANLVQIYAINVHPYWPILHSPTLVPCTGSTPPLLLGAVAMLAQWSIGDAGCEALGPLVFEAGTEMMNDHAPHLFVLQSQLLCLVHLMNRLDEYRAEAMRLNSVLISNCRFLSYFSGEAEDLARNDLSGESFEGCILEEQAHRLAFGVLQADAYLSLLLGTPPTVRHHELEIPLPMDDQTWLSIDAPKWASWRRVMNIAGSIRAPFHSLVQEWLDMRMPPDGSFSPEFYHYMLLALGAGTFDSARQTRLLDRSDVPFPQATAPDDRLSPPLHAWRERFEKDYAPRKTYYNHFNKPDPKQQQQQQHHPQNHPQHQQAHHQQQQQPLQPPSLKYPSSISTGSYPHTPFDLILYHLSCLQLVAPPEILRRPSRAPQAHFPARRRPHQEKPPVFTESAPQRPDLATRLYAWVTTKYGSRQALWHAGQLLRLVARELKKLNGGMKAKGGNGSSSSSAAGGGGGGGAAVATNGMSSVFGPGPAAVGAFPPPPPYLASASAEEVAQQQQQQQSNGNGSHTAGGGEGNKRIPCLTPLLSPALLAASTVLCTYACLRRTCPVCRGAPGSAFEVIHDLSAVDEDVDVDDDGEEVDVEVEDDADGDGMDVEGVGSGRPQRTTRRVVRERKMVRWLMRGEDIMPGLGWLRPLCQCQFRDMAGRFRSVLGRLAQVSGGGDAGPAAAGGVGAKAALREFVLYIRELERIQMASGSV